MTPFSSIGIPPCLRSDIHSHRFGRPRSTTRFRWLMSRPISRLQPAPSALSCEATPGGLKAGVHLLWHHTHTGPAQCPVRDRRSVFYFSEGKVLTPMPPPCVGLSNFQNSLRYTDISSSLSANSSPLTRGGAKTTAHVSPEQSFCR